MLVSRKTGTLRRKLGTAPRRRTKRSEITEQAISIKPAIAGRPGFVLACLRRLSCAFQWSRGPRATSWFRVVCSGHAQAEDRAEHDDLEDADGDVVRDG